MTDKPPIIAASTILMVREKDELEVLMVKRHHQIEFSAGALVFPGGKVDAEDSDPAWLDLLDGVLDDAVANYLRVAAIREAFEESGLLLARPAARRGISAPLLHPDEAPAVFETLGRVSNTPSPASFLDLIRSAGLVLAADTLVPFANWLTPDVPSSIMAKRFDTHFFLAAAPPAQSVVCDGREAVDACWIAPRQALEDAREKRRSILFPTRMNLEVLARHQGADEAIAAAQARPLVKVTPELVMEDGVKLVRIPAEAGYSVTSAPLDVLTRG